MPFLGISFPPLSLVACLCNGNSVETVLFIDAADFSGEPVLDTGGCFFCGARGIVIGVADPVVDFILLWLLLELGSDDEGDSISSVVIVLIND